MMPLLALLALGIAWVASQSPSTAAAGSKAYLLEAGRRYAVTVGGEALDAQIALDIARATAIAAGHEVISGRKAARQWRLMFEFVPPVNMPVEVPGGFPPFGTLIDVRIAKEA